MELAWLRRKHHLRACIPLATSLLAPPKDPYYGDGSCIVEEEIPPYWQETPLNVMATVDEDDTTIAVETTEVAEEMDAEMMEDLLHRPHSDS
jgi:hypothetical protein